VRACLREIFRAPAVLPYSIHGHRPVRFRPRVSGAATYKQKAPETLAVRRSMESDPGPGAARCNAPVRKRFEILVMSSSNGRPRPNSTNEPAVLLGGHEAKSYSYVRASDRSQSWQPANQPIDFDSMCGVLSGSPGGVCGCDAGRAGRDCRVAGELVSARASFPAPSLAPARPLTSLLPRRSVRSAHCTGMMEERIVAVRRAAMPCAAPSALGSWNATAKLFAAHATNHQWHCTCVAFLSPRRCLQLASWRLARMEISDICAYLGG
jgi:hypothetical protein